MPGDPHSKSRKVTFALTFEEYELLESIAKKRNQSVQYVVETRLEAKLDEYIGKPVDLTQAVSRLRFRDGKEVKTRLTELTHNRLTNKADQSRVSTGYLARVWVVDLIEQLKHQEQKSRKEVVSTEAKTLPVPGRRKFWQFAAALLGGFFRRK